MRNELPTEARLRILRKPRAVVANVGVRPGRNSIFVGRDQWATCVEDSGAPRFVDDASHSLDAFLLASSTDDAASLRRSADRLVDDLRSLISRVNALSWLRPARPLLLADLSETLVTAHLAALDAAALGRSPDPDLALPGRAEWRDRLAACGTETSADPWLDTFGAGRDALLSSDGLFSSARLLWEFHGGYDDLQDRLNGLFDWLNPAPIELGKASGLAAYMLDSSRPYLTVFSGLAALREIDAGVERDIEWTASVLRDLARRVDRSYSSQQGVIRTMRTYHAAEGADERAFIALDLYRRAIEAQWRPVIWTMLRLITGRGAAGAPEVGRIAARLDSDGGDLARVASSCLDVAARNGAAHEDYFWDSGTGQLIVGETRTSESDLMRSFDRVYAFMCGVELAWSKAKSASVRLRTMQDAGQGIEPEPIRIERARSWFGTNGLQLVSSKRIDDRYEVVVQTLTRPLMNPAVQALMWAAADLPHLRRFRLGVAGAPEVVMDVTRESLTSCLRLWMAARPDEEAMPFSVFLPAHAENNLRIWSADHVVEALDGLALTDALDAFDEAGGAAGRPSLERRRSRFLLSRRLARISNALDLTDRVVFPANSGRKKRRRVARLVTAASNWVAVEARSGQPGDSVRLHRELLAAEESWPDFDPYPRLRDK